MALVLDRCQFTTATTGTGTVTVGSATSGYQTPASAGAVNGAIYSYFIVDGTAWEVGTGTYTSAGTTLSRTLIASSTGSLLNLSGSAVVTIAPNTADFNPPHPGLVSGLWYGPPRTNSAGSAVTIDIPYAVPVYIPAPTTIQALGMRITAAVAGNVKMGIYSNSGGRPGTLLGTISTPQSTGSIATVTSAMTANVVITSSGYYWLASIFSAACSAQGYATNDQAVAQIVGANTALQAMSTGTTAVTGTGTNYTTGLLSTFGTPSTPSVSAVPMVAFQVL